MNAPFRLFSQWIMDKLTETPSIDIREFSHIKCPADIEILLINSDHCEQSTIFSNRLEKTDFYRIAWSNDTEAWIEVSEKINAISESPYSGYNFLTEDAVNDVSFFISRGQRESLL